MTFPFLQKKRGSYWMEQLALPSSGSEPSSTTPTSQTSRFDWKIKFISRSIFWTLNFIWILKEKYKDIKILTESGLFSAEVRCFLGEFEVVVEMRLRLRLRTGEGVMFNLNFC